MEKMERTSVHVVAWLVEVGVRHQDEALDGDEHLPVVVVGVRHK